MTTRKINGALLFQGLLLLFCGCALAFSVAPELSDLSWSATGLAFDSYMTTSWELSGAPQTGAFGTVPSLSAPLGAEIPGQLMGLAITAVLTLVGGFGMTACALEKRIDSCS